MNSLARIQKLFAVTFLLIAAKASATTMIPFNLAQLSQTADQAFVIRVDSVETTKTAHGHADEIHATVIDPVFNSPVSGQPVHWLQAKLNSSVNLPGMPRYTVGKEYLIFLAGPGPDTGFQSPMALGQGTFNVLRNSTTGAAIVRNEFGNTTLGAGLNVESVATDIIDQSSRSRSMDATTRAREVQQLRMQLKGGPATSLDALKQAARFFHERKLKGANPAQDYRTSAPARLLH